MKKYPAKTQKKAKKLITHVESRGNVHRKEIDYPLNVKSHNKTQRRNVRRK